MEGGPPAGTGAYRLDELGWLQFERLVDSVIATATGGELPEWTGRLDEGRIGLLDGAFTLPGRARRPGPVLVLATWPGQASRRELAERGREVARLAGLHPASVVAFAAEPRSAESDAEWRAALAELGERDPLLLGAGDLGALLDGDPGLRSRVPSVLGVRDLDGLVDAGVLERSTADVVTAHRLARVFVPTTTYAQTLRVLERSFFAVITGPPEMGKTAIARTIALSRLAEGWEAHECTDPAQLWDCFDAAHPQVFIADDAFGSTEYRADAAERWARELDRVLRSMDSRHWLLWTSRPAPLKAGLARLHLERGVERFPRPAEVHVDAAGLDVEEKASILFRHARLQPLTARGVEVVQTHGVTLVGHSHFTPERIRRFVTERLPALEALDGPVAAADVADAVRREIHEPTRAMRASLLALDPEYRELLVALLDTPPGPASERELAAAARRHLDHGLRHSPADLVDRLTDHFLRVVPPHSVTWVHPSWRDLVIDHVAEDPAERRRFLDGCALEGLLLALSVGGGVIGERTFPFLVDDADWDAAARRAGELLPALEDTELVRLLVALEAAARAPAPEFVRAEARALAQACLDQARVRVDGSRTPISLGLLEAWYGLAETLGRGYPELNVAATWFELLPTHSMRTSTLDEVARTGDWLRLEEILERYDPAVLERFGIPEDTCDALERLLEDASRLTPERRATPLGDALRACAVRVARGRLGPRLAAGQRSPTETMGAWLGYVDGDPDLDPDVDLDAGARTPLPEGGEQELVERVLRDLRPSA